MQGSLLISILFHVTIILVAYFGIPLLPDRDLIVEAPLVVEVVNISDVSNVPPPKPQAKKPEPKKKPEPPKEKPKPPPPAPKKPEPSAPEPEPEAEIIPEKVKPKPKPEPKPEVKKPQPRLKTAKVQKKPKPPKKQPDFDALMKNLAPTLKKAPKVENKEDDIKLDDLAKEIEAAIKRPSKFSDASKPLSITEIDALRQHIAKCWNPPIGAKDAENLKIEIEVRMNPDGTPRAASIGSRSNLSDPFYRAAAESALRAVNNRRCWPYPLSQETYDQWQDLTLIFDPKELLGL